MNKYEEKITQEDQEDFACFLKNQLDTPEPIEEASEEVKS